jgi:aspartyl/asparaginyl-tRNA synthetase
MERWLQHTYQRVKETHGDAVRERFGVEMLPPVACLSRAFAWLRPRQCSKQQGYQVPPEKKGDIDPGGERVLGQWVKQQHGHDFFFLTDWPAAVRPFYHMRSPEEPALTRSFDLIACGLELATGAQREHRADVLAQQAREKGLGLESIQFYLDFFRYGCPPHGGFGFGLARFLMVLLGLPNIRETVFLFRGPTRLHP